LSDIWCLEFGFNLNQGCTGVGTRRNSVPTHLLLAPHPCTYNVCSYVKRQK